MVDVWFFACQSHALCFHSLPVNIISLFLLILNASPEHKTADIARIEERLNAVDLSQRELQQSVLTMQQEHQQTGQRSRSKSQVSPYHFVFATNHNICRLMPCYLYSSLTRILQVYAKNKAMGLIEEGILWTSILLFNIVEMAAVILFVQAWPKLCDDEGKSESIIQYRCDESIWNKLNPNQPFNDSITSQKLAEWGDIELHTTHKITTIEELKPDCVLISKGGYAPSAITIIGTIEKKSGSSHEFSPENKQQVMDYNHALLIKQTTRRQVFSILHNAKYVVLIKSERFGGTDSELRRVKHKISGACAIHEDAGQSLLKKFFSMTVEQHGYEVPNIPGFKLKDVLGQGSTSTAYCITRTSDSRDFVAKVYHRKEQAQADMEHEAYILKLLQPVKHVPILVETTSATIGSCTVPCLVLSPVGLHMQPPSTSLRRSLTPTDINMIIDVLQQAHCNDIIHRDVRLANLYLIQDGGVLVNDWGCACKKVKLIPYHVLNDTLITIESTLSVWDICLPVYFCQCTW